jgi:glycosyltransferase involved in cell wall biosynthesis
MRICFLDESLFLGGTDAVNGGRVQSLALAREFIMRGHEAFFLSGSDFGHQVPPPGEREGVPVFAFNRPARLPLLGACAASRGLRELAPDVVYVRGRFYVTGVAAWAKWRRGVGFVWASNAEEGCERWKQLRHTWRSSRPFYRKLLRGPGDVVTDLVTDMGVARADQHVCQTRHQCQRLSAVHHREATLIRSLQTVPPDLPPKAAPPLILWIGRISPERGPEQFVELARSLAERDCDFVMVGPPINQRYLDEVLGRAEGLDRFSYIGEVSLAESWQWIARARVLVNTSHVEGVSNALVQAWHCATPTVALHFDPDGIIESSGAGFLSRDPARLTADIALLLSDPGAYERASTCALELARGEFSAEAVGAEYESLLFRAAQRG